MVIVRIWEGLGNQMFQYAYARALKERGVDVRIDLKKAYDGAFKKNRKHVARYNVIQNYKITLPGVDVETYRKYAYLQRRNIVDNTLCYLGEHSLLKYKFYEEKDILYKEKLAALNGEWYIKGWFQDQRYFSEINNILVKEFAPRELIKISPNIRTAIENKESVSVHIRRTDYVKMQNALNLTYYEKAIKYMKTIYKNPVFLIFSDDIEWAKENLKEDIDMLFVNENGSLHDYEELFIMSRCSSNIIANSTFSWWAAWLNRNEDKCVVAPGKWFPNQKQIILKDWVVL